MKKQSFVGGTFILAASAFVTRWLVFFNHILLARLIGAEGIGLMLMAQPLILLIITIADLGMPTAVSKIVAEAEAEKDDAKVNRILLISLVVTGSLSLALTALSLIGAKFISSLFLTDQRAYYAMLLITPIAPLIVISNVLKGFFYGKQNMKPSALSNVMEQAIRIAFNIGLVLLLLPSGMEYAVGGAMISNVIGQAASLVYLLSVFYLYRKKTLYRIKPHVPQKMSNRLRKGKNTLLELLKVGLPSTGYGIIASISHVLEPFLITKSIALAGISSVMATKQYGILAGYVLPLLFFPGFITHSLSTALIPATSEASVHKNDILIHQKIDQAIRIALVVGAPSTVILYIWAEPLTTLLYHAPEAGKLLKLLAPFFLLHYFEGPLHGVLLGLGKAKTVMTNFLITMIVQNIAIYELGSKFGISGAAIGLNIGVFLITLLNFFSVCKSIGFYFELRAFAKILFSSLVMALCGKYAFSLALNSGLSLSHSLIISVSFSLILYLFSMKFFDIHSGQNTIHIDTKET